MKTSKKNLKNKTLCLLGVALVFLCACNSPPKDGEPLRKMGFVLPFGESESAKEIQRGAELAQLEINGAAKNGNALRLLFLDSAVGSNPLGLALKLTLDRCDTLFLGFDSQFDCEIKNLAAINGVGINYFCKTPPATQYPNAGRFFINGAQECEIMADAIPESERAGRRAVIMGSSNPLGQSCSAYLRYLLGSSKMKILSDSFNQNETNFDIFSAQAAEAKFDYILCYGEQNTANAMLKSLVKYGFTGAFISGANFNADDIPPNAACKIYYVRLPFDAKNPKNGKAKKFVEDYKYKFRKLPSVEAAYAYESVQIFNNAPAQGGMKDISGKTFDTVLGKIHVDNHGDTSSELELAEIGR